MTLDALLPGGPYIPMPAATRQCSILNLVRCLLDMHLGRDLLAGAAVARPAQRGSAQGVESDGDPHMGIGGTHPVRGIEGNPTEFGHEGFGPGVAAVALGRTAVAADIAGHVARGDAETASGSNEDVGKILRAAAPAREGLGSGHYGAVGSVVNHILSRARMTCRRSSAVPPAASRAAAAKAAMFASVAVSGVSRR